MNIRNVTIWTIWLLLIVTVVVPIVVYTEMYFGGPIRAVHYIDEGDSIFVVPEKDINIGGCIIGSLFVWFYTGFLLVFFFSVARKPKYDVSVLIWFAATVLYGIWYAYVWWHLFFVEWESNGIKSCFDFSLVVMCSAYIITQLLNSYYDKRMLTDPGIERNTDPSPVPLNNPH